ncbi:MAG: NADH-quinone oxidoreductase subunit NuoF [Caldisericia bacterium]|nr:NADH-quinone oxidoreductase subunit NuoF [Caldisericia bacterium]
MKFYRTHVLVAQDTKSILAGSKRIEETLIEEIKLAGLENEIRVIPTGSLGYSENNQVAIAIYPDNIIYAPVLTSSVKEIVEEHFLKGRIIKALAHPMKHKEISMEERTSENQLNIDVQKRIILKNVGQINPESIHEYIAADGYMALEKALSEMTPESVIEEMKTSELRGRGGAGFPTGLKWQFTRPNPGPTKYVICNADEGEPGTFKDREIMEGDPHKMVEGMILAAYAVGGTDGYIYIRGEYNLSINRLQKAIDACYEYGLLGKNILGTDFSFDLCIHTGAGAYICGEETALINSIEGKRGEPRKKPPYPPSQGLWQKPTLVNNVETFANVPAIINHGGEWYKTLGVEGSYGTKLFSLMGDLNWKGTIEIPFGTTIGKIVDTIGHGVRYDRVLKGIILGGSSGSLIVPGELNTPIDFQSLSRIEAGPGSGSILVMDETRCIVDICLNIAEFFRHESCGKCTPCREGNAQICHLLEMISYGYGLPEDLEKLERIANTMMETSFCPLGQTAPSVLLQALKKFRGEFLAHIDENICPAGVCEINFVEEECSCG